MRVLITNPLTYSDSNVPYQPKRHLRISMDGVSEGDFTMIMGYPGSTDRFLSSWGIDQALRLYNPSVVDVRDLKLTTMKEHMDADPAVRIQYAAKYAQAANYWKYYIGQSKGLKRSGCPSQESHVGSTLHQVGQRKRGPQNGIRRGAGLDSVVLRRHGPERSGQGLRVGSRAHWL